MMIRQRQRPFGPVAVSLALGLIAVGARLLREPPAQRLSLSANASTRGQRTFEFTRMTDPASLFGLYPITPSVTFRDLATRTVTTLFVTQISNPGDAHVFANGTVALAGGDGSGSGVLVIANKDGQGSYSIAGNGTYIRANSGFAGLGYDSASSQLYLLDCVNKQVLAASYTPGNPPPAVWQVILDSTSWPPSSPLPNTFSGSRIGD